MNLWQKAFRDFSRFAKDGKLSENLKINNARRIKMNTMNELKDFEKVFKRVFFYKYFTLVRLAEEFRCAQKTKDKSRVLLYYFSSPKLKNIKKILSLGKLFSFRL